jgi:TonB family protein
VLPQAAAQAPTKPENKITSPPKATIANSKKSAAPSLTSPIRSVEAIPLENESPIEEPPQLMANPPDVAEETLPKTETETPDDKTEVANNVESSLSESEKEPIEPTPALVANEIIDESPAETEKPIEPAKPAKNEAPKALVTQSMLSEETSESATQATTQESADETVRESGAIAGDSKTEKTKSTSTGESGGAAGQGGGNSQGLKGPITGAVGVEIRDASELASLPGNPKPSYPAQDRLRKYEGKAVLVGRVGADGRMSQVLVERSSGSTAMDASAIEAFKRWRYRPGQQSWVRQPFQFRTKLFSSLSQIQELGKKMPLASSGIFHFKKLRSISDQLRS